MWNLVLSEKAFSTPGRCIPPAGDFLSPITIGEYFLAAKGFLANEGWRLPASAFRKQIGNPLLSPPHPVSISLFLEKHGAFYHPMKVLINQQGHQPCALVLNGAVSRPGLALVEREPLLLSNIARQVPLQVFPRVYGRGGIDSEKGAVGFFLGEWFEDYCEFHVSVYKGDPCIAVWCGPDEIRRFPIEQMSHIYQDIAYVLTSAYNLETGEQIFPWHHAAGDFIVDPKRIEDPVRDEVGVKLITVRGYDRLASVEGGSGVSLLTGLLIFFLNLSLRMQLDKKDGIGETVFMGASVLKATLAGFFQGIDMKAAGGLANLKRVFVDFAGEFTPEQWAQILEKILEPQINVTSERLVIRKNLKQHCRSLHLLLKTEYRDDFY